MDREATEERNGSGGERGYKCQRCLNHNRVVCRKGHRCPYKDCACSGCNLNNLRSKLMTVLRERGLNHSEVFMTKNSGRKQHCMLCSFHGERVELRGHKRQCSWANCQCSLCVIGRHYRDTMAKQTKHRRSQRKPGAIHRDEAWADPGATGSSRRVAMKKDWCRRIKAVRAQGARNSDNDKVGREKEGNKTTGKVDAGVQHSPQTNWDQEPLKQPALVCPHPAAPISAATALPGDTFGQWGPAGCQLLSTPTLALAMHQQRAVDAATAVFLSRCAWPLPPACTGCHQPSPLAHCHQAQSLWNVDGYVNALREYAHHRNVLSHLELSYGMRATDASPTDQPLLMG